MERMREREGNGEGEERRKKYNAYEKERDTHKEKSALHKRNTEKPREWGRLDIDNQSATKRREGGGGRGGEAMIKRQNGELRPRNARAIPVLPLLVSRERLRSLHGSD